MLGSELACRHVPEVFFWFVITGQPVNKQVSYSLRLSEILQCWIDCLEGLVDLFSNLGASEHDLTTDEYQQDDLGLDHSVDKAREELRLIGTERMMLGSKTFKSNRELDVAGSNDVLNLEICELGIEAQLLNDSSILSAGKLRVILRLGTSDDHLA